MEVQERRERARAGGQSANTGSEITLDMFGAPAETAAPGPGLAPRKTLKAGGHRGTAEDKLSTYMTSSRDTEDETQRREAGRHLPLKKLPEIF